MSAILVSNERQAREIGQLIADLDQALSSEQALRAIAVGLPHEVVKGLHKSLTTERKELFAALSAYNDAKNDSYNALLERAGSDPGSFLIAARIMRGLSQKDLARKLGLREQAVQRWETEKYRSISIANYQKIARSLNVQWSLKIDKSTENWSPSYDVTTKELSKVIKHARENGWLDTDDTSDEHALATLVRYVGDHVTRYGTPSLLRTGMGRLDNVDNWPLLTWKAQVTRRAIKIIDAQKPRYRPIDVSWLIELVQLSKLDDGPVRARDLLLDHGIILVIEPQISGMPVDGAAFLVDETPVIGMTLLRDYVDNFWFTLLHEVGHIILHYRTGLSSGFFDDLSAEETDEFEEEANTFARNLLIPEELWARSPVRISKTAEPAERLAAQLGINSAIVFGRIRKERNDYSIFSNRVGRGLIRRQFLSTN